jgi:phosphopantothenoylcysteine decarboxylase/phosphopantothenate--cysteine ligase
VLKKSNILLGVTGSIAAYKSVDIARRIMEEGAGVRVVMTGAAKRAPV